MAEIIKFQPHAERNVEKNAKRDEAIAEVRKRKVRDLKITLDKIPRMAKSSERAIVATNLWRLLERLEGEGIKKSSVVKSWHQGSGTDSTKRLYTYLLPPDLPEKERTQRASKLTQKVAGYRRLAEHAAKLQGGDADSFLSEIFRGTSYESQSNVLPDELDALWVVYMRDLLLKVCDWVARRNDVAQYFTKIESELLSIGDNDGPWGRTFVRHGGDQYLSRLRLGELLHHSWIGDCIPSVLLSRRELQCINGEMRAAERNKDGVMPPEQGEGHSTRCEIVTYLELYLAVAPLGPDRAPRGVFELRVVTDIRTNEGFSTTKIAAFEDYFDEHYGGIAKPLDEWRLVWRTETDDDLIERELPFWVRVLSQEQMNLKPGASRPTFKIIPPSDVKIVRAQPIEVSGCRLFRDIDLCSIYEFLGYDYSPDPTGFELGECEAWAVGLDDFADETPVVSPQRTLAHLIEKNLYVSKKSDRLDNLLDDRASFLSHSVHAYLRERSDRLDKLKNDTLKRYD